MNHKTALVVILLALGVLGCSNPSLQIPAPTPQPVASPYTQTTYLVKRIADGDTITVTDSSEKNIKVRFACVDAPEVAHSKKELQYATSADRDQFKWGIKAQSRLKQLIQQAGNRVSLTMTDTDRYGRRVGEVYLVDGTLVQEVLAREGLVLVYQQYLSDCPSAAVVEQAEAQAKQQKLNVWGDSQFTLPWEWRHGNKERSRRH